MSQTKNHDKFGDIDRAIDEHRADVIRSWSRSDVAEPKLTLPEMLANRLRERNEAARRLQEAQSMLNQNGRGNGLRKAQPLPLAHVLRHGQNRPKTAHLLPKAPVR